MRMQLRIALPARAVHEPGHHPTLGGHPPAHPLRLHPGHRRPLLQEPQRRLHRLPVSGRHRLGHRLRAERPQQRHALRGRESQIERPHRTGPRPRQQILAGHRVLPLDQGPQLVGLHHTGQARALRPPARPHPRRLAHPGVVLVDAQRHRRDQILRIRQPRHRQHPPPPPTPSTIPSPSTAMTPSPPPSPHRPPPRLPTSQPSTDTCHPFGEATAGAVTTTPTRGQTPPGPGTATAAKPAGSGPGPHERPSRPAQADLGVTSSCVGRESAPTAMAADAGRVSDAASVDDSTSADHTRRRHRGFGHVRPHHRWRLHAWTSRTW